MKELSDSQISEHYAIVNTLGHAVLVETLRSAAYYVVHSNGSGSKNWHKTTKIKEAAACYAFVQGSSLQILINRFGFDYNADFIRTTFNYCVRHSAC